VLRPTSEDLATRPFMRRNPGVTLGAVPQSVFVDERPAKIIPDTEIATQWSPYFHAVARPYMGGHDELSEHGRGIMHVAQAGLYDSSPNPWPNNGQYDRPNGGSVAMEAQIAMQGRQRETSAHKGFMNPTGAGPTMLFHAPPIFGLQTKPIPAVGV
jgi:hypothetical protein